MLNMQDKIKEEDSRLLRELSVNSVFHRPSEVILFNGTLGAGDNIFKYFSVARVKNNGGEEKYFVSVGTEPMSDNYSEITEKVAKSYMDMVKDVTVVNPLRQTEHYTSLEDAIHHVNGTSFDRNDYVVEKLESVDPTILDDNQINGVVNSVISNGDYKEFYIKDASVKKVPGQGNLIELKGSIHGLEQTINFIGNGTGYQEIGYNQARLASIANSIPKTV